MFLLFSFLLSFQTFSTVLNVEEFSVLMENEHTLVDVRTAEEFADAALPKAINISVTDLSFPLEISKLDKEKPVLIYCKKGGRSARAAVIMKTLGFEKIYELRGGFLSWEAAKD